MRVIDYSDIKTTDGKLSIGDRISGIFRYGFSWPKQVEAQQTVIDHLNKILGNRFTILKDYTLPEIDVPIPLILIGPHGVTVIVVSSLAGIYRAKHDSWNAMDSRARKFKPVNPNLITRTQLMGQAVRKFLDDKDIHISELEGVLIFTHPGTHVDSIRPAVRVILMDAIDRFANRLNQSHPIFTAEDIRKVVEVFDTGHREAAGLKEDGTPIDEMDESTRSTSAVERSLGRMTRVFNFNRRQWIALFGMIVVELCVIVIFIAIIFYTAYF